jgi:hypothetical protein
MEWVCTTTPTAAPLEDVPPVADWIWIFEGPGIYELSSIVTSSTIHGRGSVRPNGLSNRPMKVNLYWAQVKIHDVSVRRTRTLGLRGSTLRHRLAAAHAASSSSNPTVVSSVDAKSPSPSWCASTRASSPTRALGRPPQIELVKEAPRLIHRRVYDRLIAGLEVQPQHRDASSPTALHTGRRRWRWAAPASRRHPPSNSTPAMPLVAPPHGSRRPHCHG